MKKTPDTHMLRWLFAEKAEALSVRLKPDGIANILQYDPSDPPSRYSHPDRGQRRHG